MAKVTSVNSTPADGADAMFRLHNFLRDQMLFVIAISGDGLSLFDNTGTSVITSAGSGAGGMNNTNAHFTARDPVGGYEWCFQRNASEVSWEVVVSALDGFTGGAFGTRPTATDEQILINTTLFTTAGTYRWHLTGDTVAIGATVGVYPWRAWSTKKGTGVPETFIAHEPMEPGTYPELAGTRATPTTGEPDPSIYICAFDSDAFDFTTTVGAWHNDTTSPAKGYYCMNGTNGQVEAFTTFQGAAYNTNTGQNDLVFPANVALTQGVGLDARDSLDPIVPFLIGRSSRLATNVGHKGVSATFRMKGVSREFPSVIDVSGERYAYMGDLLIPWENGAVPLT